MPFARPPRQPRATGPRHAPSRSGLRSRLGPVGLVLVLAAAACHRPQPSVSAPAPRPRQATVAAIKSLEKELGFEKTGSFSRHSDGKHADYRCYYTGKLDLPASYERLRVANGNEHGCDVDQEKYDVFFYPIEAVASGKSALTSSLADASLERLSVVVIHEDFHQHHPVRKLPEPMAEAAATLVGFVTAAEFARRQFGEASDAYDSLAGEAARFQRKAELVNRYHARLTNLYAAARRGEITRPQALEEKQRIFAELERRCQAITPRAASFNPCLAAGNNAGLAFDHTYTRRYPLLYRLYGALGRDVRKTIAAIERLPQTRPKSEHAIVKRVEEMIRQRTSAPDEHSVASGGGGE